MEDHRNVFTLFLLAATVVVNVSCADSTINWAMVNDGDSQSCILSLAGDPTEWVPNVNEDSSYEVSIAPMCVDSSFIQIGPLANHPSIPHLVLFSDLIDNALMYFEVIPEGDVDTFYGGSLNVTGIAVDYQSQNVYYTDPEIGLMIVQFGVSRPYFNILLDDLDDPHHLVLDADEGHLFWAESTSIKRATLNGESVEEILNGVSRDTLLAIDTEAQKLFVMDQEKGTLKSMAYDGTDLTTLLDNSTTYTPGMLSGISADQGYIFGAVAEKAVLMVWKQADGELMANLDLDIDGVKQYGITVNKAEAVSSTSQCSQDNGGCSHICIHQPSGSRVCRCGIGYDLQADGTSCKPVYLSDKFLLVTDIGVDGIYQIQTDTEKIHGVPVERTYNQRIESVVYDPTDKAIIWIDTGNGTLRRKVLEDGAEETVIFTFTNESLVEGIAFDKRERLVYYTDAGLGEIGRIDLEGNQKVIVEMAEDEIPLQIKLDTSQGFMYWTDVGESPKIERARMSDGSYRKTIVETEIVNPTGLALNLRDSLLYWIDSDQERVEQINIDGERRLMLDSISEIYSLSLDDDYLYMTRTHDVRRFSLTDQPQSTLGMKVFSVLNGVSLYSSEVTVTEGTTSSPRDSGVSLKVTETVYPVLIIWWLMWHQIKHV